MVTKLRVLQTVIKMMETGIAVGKVTHIGIDIGKRGAIVIIGPTGSLGRYKMPMKGKDVDYHGLYNILEVYADIPSQVVFEKLQPIFGSSKTTAFSMGHQAGAVEMACIALKMPYVKVAPKVWQKEMFDADNIIKGDTKASALIAARKIFPKENLIFPKGKVPHDGLVDALLLAEYGRRRSQRYIVYLDEAMEQIKSSGFLEGAILGSDFKTK